MYQDYSMAKEQAFKDATTYNMLYDGTMSQFYTTNNTNLTMMWENSQVTYEIMMKDTAMAYFNMTTMVDPMMEPPMPVMMDGTPLSPMNMTFVNTTTDRMAMDMTMDPPMMMPVMNMTMNPPMPITDTWTTGTVMITMMDMMPMNMTYIMTLDSVSQNMTGRMWPMPTKAAFPISDQMMY